MLIIFSTIGAVAVLVSIILSILYCRYDWLDEFKIENEKDYLGHGGFGKVFKVVRKRDGKEFAAKIER